MRTKGRPAQGHQIQSRILHRSQFIHRRRIICTDFRTGNRVILALVALISSRIMWKKGIIKVVDNDETASEKAE